jgi:diguanylate cyclase (GGDEF)-like protein
VRIDEDGRLITYGKTLTRLESARAAQVPQALARLAIVGLFIALWLALWVAGIPMPLPFLAVLLGEAAFFLIYWRAVSLLSTVQAIQRAHYLMLAAEIVFHTTMVYFLSSITWLGPFAYLFGLIFSNTYLDPKRGLAYTAAAASAFLALIVLEATGMVPHYVYLDPGPLRYEDPRFVVTTAVGGVGVFFSIYLWINWVGSELRRERDNAVNTQGQLADARQALERTNSELENRVLARTSELERAVAALREGEELLRATVESTADGILVVASDGKVVHANERFAQMWRIPPDLISARDDDALLAYVLEQLADPETFLARVRELYRSGDEDFDTLRFKDGRAFERYSRPLLRDDQVAGRVWSFRDVSERQLFEARLIDMANHDALTGLFNRRRFDEELEAQVARARRYGVGGALLFLDLDQFKDVNDSRGHGAGDELLVALALLLRERLRETDVIARLGGDEFAVLLPHTDAARASLAAQDILDAVRERTFEIGGAPLGITASVGIALYPEHGENAAELLSRADVAMYQAKEQGRNRVRTFSTDTDWQAEIARRMDWQRRIHDALEHERFVLHAQPILDLSSHEVTQYELLLRAVDVDGELVLPGEFLDVAERSGLIREIDRWVVRRAICLIAAQARAGRRLEIEVNLSGQAFSDPTLRQAIQDEIATTGIDPQCLILEVTETAAITNLEEAQRFIRALRALGCRFALDDFGVGFSSFAHLKYLPVDYVKIDGSFIRDLPRSTTDQHLVRAIADIARALGKRTIAEFVNDEATVALLREFGVDFAQGFYIGRPGPRLDAAKDELAA